ncbi:skin secretory protein xP2-like [Schistocerca nitens]|uniref:skin secretory protein xP2-like n=1 Tax=Schistocerca nitens TaxID=7011 RepID=UPI002117E0A0|nr:skin secretory protein xP2-like [Schistocerca nitens]
MGKLLAPTCAPALNSPPGAWARSRPCASPSTRAAGNYICSSVPLLDGPGFPINGEKCQLAQVKIWFQNRRTKWKKQDNISNAEAAEHKNQATGKPEAGAAKPKEGAPAKPAQPGAKAAPLAALPGAKLGAGGGAAPAPAPSTGGGGPAAAPASLPSPSSGEDHSNASVFTAGDGSASESCFGDPTQPPPPPPPHHVLTVSVQDSSRSPTVSPPKTPALAPTPPSVAAPVPMVVDPLPAPTPPTPTPAPAAVSTPPLAVQMQMSAPLAQPELMEAPRPVSPSS